MAEHRNGQTATAERPRCDRYVSAKLIYTSRGEAETAAAELRRFNGDDDLAPFRCQRGCKGWHVGHVQPVQVEVEAPVSPEVEAQLRRYRLAWYRAGSAEERRTLFEEVQARYPEAIKPGTHWDIEGRSCWIQAPTEAEARHLVEVVRDVMPDVPVETGEFRLVSFRTRNVEEGQRVVGIVRDLLGPYARLRG